MSRTPENDEVQGEVGEGPAVIDIDELWRKHAWEAQNNTVVSMEDFREIEYMDAHLPATRASETPTSHEPPAAILVVAENLPPAVAHESALGSAIEDVRRSFGVIVDMVERRKRAEYDLRGDGEWNGLVKGLKNIRARKKDIDAVDEETLPPETLAKHQRLKLKLEQDSTSMSAREFDAQNFVAHADHDIASRIAQTLARFSALPKDLQGAIMQMDKSYEEEVFKKYDLSPDAASLVNIEMARRKREKLARLASVAGTPALADYSREEIETALTERGIPTENIGDGIIELVRVHKAEEAARVAEGVAAYNARMHASTSSIERARAARSAEGNTATDAEVAEEVSALHATLPTPVPEAEELPPPSTLHAVVVGGASVQPLSGVYYQAVGDEAIYDKKTGLRVDNPDTAGGVAPTKDPIDYRGTPALLRAEGGLITRGSTTDPESMLEHAALEKILRAKREKKVYPKVDTTPDPSLKSFYTLNEDGTIKNDDAQVAAGGVVAAMPSPDAPVDEAVSQEMIDGWSEQGIVIPKGATAAEANKIIRDVGVARAMESIAADDARIAKEVGAVHTTPPTPMPEAEEPPPLLSEEVPTITTTEDGTTYNSVLDTQWANRAVGIEAPAWSLVGDEKESPTEAPITTPKERMELDGVGEQWASFLEREYGLDVAENNAAPLPTLAEVVAKSEELESLATPDIDPPLLEPEGPPVAKPELFDAFNAEVELAKIMQAPKAERRILLAAYKEQLALQKIGIGNAQKTLIALVRKNPEMTKDAFIAQFRELTSEFHPTIAQVVVAEKAFLQFQQKHLAVLEYSNRYPDPSALFLACFGELPVGRVELIKGPMTLCFRCHDNRDYALLYKGAGNKLDALSQGDIERAVRSGGCAGVTTLITELNGTVIAERADGGSADSSTQIYEHEEQHAMNAVLSTNQEVLFDDEKNDALTLEAALSAREEFDTMRLGGSDKEREKAQFMFDKELERIALYDARILRAARASLADKRAADEILAYTKDGRKADTIFELLIKKEKDGGLYDYLKDEQVAGVFIPTGEVFLSSMNTAQPGEFIKILNDRFTKVKEEVFGQEYHDTIQSGIDAYMQLREHGLAEEAIRSVLQHEPLTRWVKVAERIVEGSPRKVELSLEVVAKFEAKFGVDEAALESIEAFSLLSPGQQMLVLRNLEQLTLSDITKEAKEKQRAEWGNTKWWKRGVQMAASFGMKPEVRIAEIEKELLASSRSQIKHSRNPEDVRRRAMTLGYIESLSEVAASSPEVVMEKGEMRINYVSIKEQYALAEHDGFTHENIAAIEAFNKTATDFAKIPHEWGYDDESVGPIMGSLTRALDDSLSVFRRKRPDEMKTNRELYEQSKHAYDRARAGLLELSVQKFEARGESKPEERAMLEMNILDERVTLNQLFNTHPDAETALQSIEDHSVWRRGMKEFWKARGNFIAYGALGRAATVTAASALAVPTMGASLLALGAVGGAGLMVGNKIGETEGKRLMKGRRLSGRMSEEDEREEVVYMNESNGIAEKRKIKEFTDAAFFVDRIERLVAKSNTEKDPTAFALVEKKIAQTTALMAAKLEAGMINFGGSSLGDTDLRRGDTIANRLSFMQAMARGTIETTVDRDVFDAHAERLIGVREARIEDVRKAEVKQIARTAAFWRAGFGLVGAGILQQIAAEAPMRSTLSRLLSKLPAATSADDVPEEIVESVKKAPPATPPAKPTPSPTAIHTDDSPDDDEEVVATPPPRPTTGTPSGAQGWTLPNPARAPETPSAPVEAPKAFGQPRSFLKYPHQPAQSYGETAGVGGSTAGMEASRNATLEATAVSTTMNTVKTLEAQMSRMLSGGELVAIKKITILELNTTNPAKLKSVGEIKTTLLDAMKSSAKELSPEEIGAIVKKVP